MVEPKRITGRMFYGLDTYDSEPREYVTASDFDVLKAEYEKMVADIKGAHRVLHDAGVRHLSDEEDQHPLGLSARISLLFGERDRLRQELQRIANPIYPHPSIKTAETSYTRAELINIATRALTKDQP